MRSASTMPDHDLPTGHLSKCQICSSSELELVVDLGHQPPCDSLLTPAQMNEAERTYPLRFVRCRECGLAQIDYAVEPELLFHPEYPYRSGITPSLVQNLQRTTHTIVDNFNIKPGALAVDIGSNDGTLLKGFKSRGLRVLGIEATNIAQIAITDGIDTVQSFFDAEVAKSIVKQHGQAAAITATNMFAHVAGLGELMKGVTHLLEDGGVFVTESHYVLDLLNTIQYDSIYHEHLKFYSVASLIRFFGYYDFKVVDVERIPNYGGSIRVYAARNRPDIRVSPRVAEILAVEKSAGLETAEPFKQFGAKVQAAKFNLLRMLIDLRARGPGVPGIGCPGRSSTLINFCNIDSDLMPYIAEQSPSLKLGLFLPGKHIPIVDEQRLFNEQPEYALMLSWHYAEAIIRNMREKGLRSKIILPLPEVRIID
jgi:hypothetical protein